MADRQPCIDMCARRDGRGCVAVVSAALLAPLVVGAAAGASGAAIAQLAAQGAPAGTPSSGPSSTGTAAAGVLRPRLDIVEQGTEDTDVLSVTLRSDPLDLRLPTAFQRVYRVPGSSTLLMRGNGALFAVFEQSTYRDASGRFEISPPPGTVFHIGMPDARSSMPSPAESGSLSSDAGVTARSDRKVDGRVHGKATRDGAGNIAAHGGGSVVRDAREGTEAGLPVRIDARVHPRPVQSAALPQDSATPMSQRSTGSRVDSRPMPERAADAATHTSANLVSGPLSSPRVPDQATPADGYGEPSGPANTAAANQPPGGPGSDPYAHLKLGLPRVAHADTQRAP